MPAAVLIDITTGKPIRGADARGDATSEVITFSQWRAPLRSPAAPDAEPDGGEDAELIRLCGRLVVNRAPEDAAPPDPDARLLELCRQLDADSRELRRHELLCAAGAPTLADDGEVYDVLRRAHGTIELIAAIPATTAAGIRAKAGALGHALMQAVDVATGLTFEEQAEDYELLAMSLVRDLGGEIWPAALPERNR